MSEPITEEQAQELSRLARARAAALDKAKLYADIGRRRWPGWVMLDEFWRRYRRLNGTALAGNLAFRIFLWLVPASLMLVAAVSFASDGGVDVESGADGTLGLGKTLSQSLAQAAAESQGSRWHAGFIALMGLLLASSGVLSALHYAAVQLWELPARPPRRRANLVGKLLGALVLAVILSSVNIALRRSGLVLGLAGLLISIGVVFSLLLGLFLIMPKRASGWYNLIPGAVVGTGLYVALQAYATIWLPRNVAALSATYGTIGIAAAALGYLFLMGLIIVVATLVNAVWWDYHLASAGGEAPLDIHYDVGSGTTGSGTTGSGTTGSAPTPGD
jgi:uncharacterized BrkB/YihY/UPF0761 family membrane protein